MKCNERVVFRLFDMPCCHFLLCWVNPRFPSHCPECGKLVYPEIKGAVVINDQNATLRYEDHAGR